MQILKKKIKTKLDGFFGFKVDAKKLKKAREMNADLAAIFRKMIDEIIKSQK